MKVPHSNLTRTQIHNKLVKASVSLLLFGGDSAIRLFLNAASHARRHCTLRLHAGGEKRVYHYHYLATRIVIDRVDDADCTAARINKIPSL